MGIFVAIPGALLRLTISSTRLDNVIEITYRKRDKEDMMAQ